MPAIKPSLVFASLVLAVACASCSSADVKGSCERIAEACHEKDTGSGEPHECHEFAEGGATDEACSEKEDDCLEACK